MENFIFQNRTKIIFGKNTEKTVGLELTNFKAKKILIHYGSERIKTTGLFDTIIKSIKEENINFVELGGVVANPRLSKVKEGIELAKKENVNFILAVGGGSVIDSAKAIAAGAKYDGDVWDFYEYKELPTKAIPIGTILTIPAAGSEASAATVITNEETKRKKAFGHPCIVPMFSILNPELTMTLPDYQTACGAADMLAHVFERYFVSAKEVDVTDNLCLAHMNSIIKKVKQVLKEPKNYEYRAELMLAGYIAHNGWLNVGRTNGDWASHMIEHELSAEYDLAHGAGLSIIFPAWMKYVYTENIEKFELFGKEVFGIEKKGEEAALEAINKLEEFYKEIELPIKMSEAKITNPNIQTMTENAIGDGELGNFKILKRKDVEDIYKLSL
ncbi:iron-containing alcohol dehydrogenase [Candidatus Woesearchaeota archaeon]|nr:iron-containing alcohol dehydrogenase [Candidatus Woesearchaeota archaeon]MCF7901532.1 iron-containing alcohol dehydrogenase [Candidatus Woesearchaeota archaeon]MCF8013876.1 iron-containing alcohol dehydrogenase [Candidatus Woesearchaeota archaeon]